ncbi:transposase [Sorangium sp. So ce1128]
MTPPASAPWRRRLAQDGALFGALTRIFVESVERFYSGREKRRGVRAAAKSGAVTVVQRTSGDMRLNPHLHVVFLDGAYHEDGTELVWNELGHLQTREVGQVLEHTVGRMMRYLRRYGLFEIEHDIDEDDEPEAALWASAVSGREPPAGPQWLRGLSPPSPSALAYDKPLCASLDGFTLHAATRAGAHHAAAREALLRYVLRPPIGLVRLSLKRAFADGTVAASMDPLSLLCRLAASVPPPRFDTVKYAGVLASASPWRKRIGPRPAKPEELAKTDHEPAPKRKRGGYRPWAELLRRTLAIDVLQCPACKGRMELVAMVTEPSSIVRFLSALGQPTDVPGRSPSADAAAAVLEEHRPAPKGARRRRVAYRSNTAGPRTAHQGDVGLRPPIRRFSRSALRPKALWNPWTRRCDARGPGSSVRHATLRRGAIGLLLPTRRSPIIHLLSQKPGA